MWHEPTAEELGKLPKLYATEPQPVQDKLVRMQFLAGGCHCYAVEYDADRRVFFGFVVLNNDRLRADWGNFSRDELRVVRVGSFQVERDLHWRQRKAIDVDRIAAACGWRHQGDRRCGLYGRPRVAKLDPGRKLTYALTPNERGVSQDGECAQVQRSHAEGGRSDPKKWNVDVFRVCYLGASTADNSH